METINNPLNFYCDMDVTIEISQQEAFENIINKGMFNIEVADFGIENDNAENFAINNLNILSIDDFYYSKSRKTWIVNADDIITAFTKNWSGYTGEGTIYIEHIQLMNTDFEIKIWEHLGFKSTSKGVFIGDDDKLTCIKDNLYKIKGLLKRTITTNKE